jgi:hypothetical protein
MLFGDLLRPFTVVSRAKPGLHAALRHNMIFHLWLHPQDLLLDPGLASKLDTFLALVAQQRESGALEVLTMGELATVLTGELATVLTGELATVPTREALRRSTEMASAVGIADQVLAVD